MKRVFCTLSLFVTLVVLQSGCESLIKRDRQAQLERVAKDWTMTIRASQVVPVYPLTQDFQPGDVFLVQQSVEEQFRTFRRKGFLPIDMQIARLAPGEYGDFYKNYVYGAPPTYPNGKSPIRLPGEWRDKDTEKSWKLMPRAGFPSYSFKVSASAGLSLGVPVQAVPVGLSLLGTAEASGSITITDAFTYGIDVSSLEREVRSDAKIQHFLNQIDNPEQQMYLRVINRVFATKNLVVTLNTESSRASGLDVGAPKDVGTPPQDQKPKATSIELAEAVNNSLESIEANLPGGSVRALAAQERSITFNEKFDEPIVFGYHGFDMAILPDGRLGPVVPTFGVLNSKMHPPSTAVSEEDIAYLAVLGLLQSIEAKHPKIAQAVFEGAAGNNPVLKSEFDRFVNSGRKASSAWVQALTRYMGAATNPYEKRTRLQSAQQWLSQAANDAELELPTEDD